jgi:ribonuclease HII
MVYANNKYEKELWEKGYHYIVGIDEVGRGSWAGPAVVGAVIFPRYYEPPYQLADSKQLSSAKRKELVSKIQTTAIRYAIEEVPIEEINKYGIGVAIQNRFKEMVKHLDPQPDFILIDGFIIKDIEKEKQKAIIKGDEQSISIAAASILAKEYRDQLMREMHQKDPRFGFNKHAGYGTEKHRMALRKYGLSQYHRKSYDLTKWITIK